MSDVTIKFMNDAEVAEADARRERNEQLRRESNSDLLGEFLTFEKIDDEAEESWRRIDLLAFKALEFNLPDDTVLSTMRVYFQYHPVEGEWSDAKLLTIIHGAKEWAKRRAATAGTTIVIVPPEHSVAQKAVDSLRGTDNLYQRGTTLARIDVGDKPPVGIERPPGAPVITSLTAPATTELLSWRARYAKPTKTGIKPSFVPTWLTNLVLARPEWPVPRLEAVIEAPVLRADGSILASKGFDSASGLYLTRHWTLPTLTLAEAKQAIDYVLCDFPFKDETSKAACVAGILTPFARFAFHDPVPLNLITANVPGCGKSLLTDVVAGVFVGRSMSRTPCPSDEDEWRKRILAVANGGDPMVLVDNIDGKLASSSLDAALTATSWTDRFLGETRMVTLPLLATWFATGNNVTLGGDLPRRVTICRLESTLERPHTRDGFKEPDLKRFVLDNRPRLASACLTILSSYMQDKPALGLGGCGTFERWSDLVRSAIVYAGWADPWTAKSVDDDADPTIELLRGLHAGWLEADPNGVGLTVAEAMNRLDTCPTLKGALAELPPSDDVATQLGRTISRHKARTVAGQCFASVGKRHGATVWVIKQVEKT